MGCGYFALEAAVLGDVAYAVGQFAGERVELFGAFAAGYVYQVLGVVG